jgi:hypothetical protein
MVKATMAALVQLREKGEVADVRGIAPEKM